MAIFWLYKIRNLDLFWTDLDSPQSVQILKYKSAIYLLDLVIRTLNILLCQLYSSLFNDLTKIERFSGTSSSVRPQLQLYF